MLELMSILHDLSTSRNYLTLSDTSVSDEQFNYKSRRLEKAFAFMHANYSDPISLAQVSAITNMKDVSFSRFIKKRTGFTFIDCLNEIRIGHASRLLIDTTNTIAEIAYKVGFNNISNFNRVFKRKKGITLRNSGITFRAPELLSKQNSFQIVHFFKEYP
ncbi:AraC family transcriptional regulator [Paraflavitalea speifideaquila]|uniref:AraC family transcriptional regulator n=1 Tax=Paraflavitalea speifideaquila TaxID=3076558 RepID=UPI0028F0EE20|nr:AraC family transcriptional regulator [Paraflavitalea speifideiaquila]